MSRMRSPPASLATEAKRPAAAGVERPRRGKVGGRRIVDGGAADDLELGERRGGGKPDKHLVGRGGDADARAVKVRPVNVRAGGAGVRPAGKDASRPQQFVGRGVAGGETGAEEAPRHGQRGGRRIHKVRGGGGLEPCAKEDGGGGGVGGRAAVGRGGEGEDL